MAEIVGVVEGFYGAPWTNEQRCLLYDRMKSIFRMNTYMYAPKDDRKHRSDWRCLYAQHECETLQNLIEKCNQNKIEFVYALSPGLTITYSDRNECETIVKKFDQVAALGCTSFALLFDDIDREMRRADLSEFDGSFSRAQCFLANKVFDHFQQRVNLFVFCPTDYCSQFAKNNSESKYEQLSNSEYLSTLGKHLNSKIDILWTGEDVISKNITVEHLEELQKAIKRRPIIWDNFHADDYDRDRIFLGPYKYRSIKIKENVRGVLANPNCEFESNFNAFFTLSKWFYANTEQNNENYVESSLQDVFSLIQSDSNEEKNNFDGVFDPVLAQRESIEKWLQIFDQSKIFEALDLKILCDFFYLPHEHGLYAQFLIKFLHSLLKSTTKKDLESLKPFYEYIKTVLMPKLNTICSKLTLISNPDLKKELIDNNRLMSELKMTLYLLINFFKMIFDEKDPYKWLKNKKLVFCCDFGDQKSFSHEIKRLLSVDRFGLTSERFSFERSNRFEIELVQNDEENLRDFKINFLRENGAKILLAVFYEDCELEFEDYYAFGLRFIKTNLNFLKADKQLEETFTLCLRAAILNLAAYFQTTNYIGIAVSNENELDKEQLFLDYKNYFDFFDESIINDRVAFFFYEF